MNRVSPRIEMTVAVAALSAFFLLAAGPASAAQPFGKDGVIHACVKAKGKNKGALRVVTGARGCKKLRGWRPLAWSATGSFGASGQTGSQGTNGGRGEQGPVGPEGKQGQQGLTGQIENSLVETIKTQATEISDLSDEVTDLGNEVLGLEGDVTSLTGGLVDLEGTVSETCSQLTTLTDQSDEIITGVTDVELNNALKLINALITFPNLPAALGAFECG